MRSHRIKSELHSSLEDGLLGPQLVLVPDDSFGDSLVRAVVVVGGARRHSIKEYFELMVSDSCGFGVR